MTKAIFIDLLAVTLLSWFSIQALLHPGLFPMHDDTQVARVFSMKASLADGMFPVRWVEELGYGYGYPIFNFYAPLAYYLGGVIDLVINDSLAATKIMLGLGILISGWTMYFLAKEFWGRVGGILSALLYVYAPYHAVNIYVRGAVGETFGYAFIPLAFYGFYKCYQEPKWRHVTIASLGFAGIILSHNLTAMMLTPFILITILLGVKISKSQKKGTLAKLLSAFALGIMLSAFYWLPSVGEMKYTNVTSQIGGGADFKDHFVCLPQLWDSMWGFGGSTIGCIDGLSFRLGKLHVILSIFVALGLFFVKKNKKQRYLVILSIVFLLICIFLMLDYSRFVWDTLAPMKYFQYPWRFLLMSSFTISLIGGGVVWIIESQQLIKINKKIITLISSIALLSILLIYPKLFIPQEVRSVTNNALTDKNYINWNVSKISDEYMPTNFKKPLLQSQIPEYKITGDLLKYEIKETSTTSLIAQINTQKAEQIHINKAYFPSWSVKINGKEGKVLKSTTGIDILVPKGNSTLHLVFVETPLEKFANLVSLSGFCILLLVIIRSRKSYPLK